MLEVGSEIEYQEYLHGELHSLKFRITKVIPDIKTKIHSPKDDGAFAFVPFCCQQQLKNGKPWIGFVFLCEAEGNPKDNPDETKDVRWMDYEELKEIFQKTPEKIFTLHLGALDLYFNQ